MMRQQKKEDLHEYKNNNFGKAPPPLTSNAKTKNVFGASKSLKPEIHTGHKNTDECRRGLGILNLHDATPMDFFKLYIEELNLQTTREFVTFNDFCEFDFSGGYPEIIYDVLYGKTISPFCKYLILNI